MRRVSGAVFVVVMAMLAVVAPLPSQASGLAFDVTPSSQAVGHAVAVQGTGCAPNQNVVINLVYGTVPVVGSERTADDHGNFVATVPLIANDLTPGVGEAVEIRVGCGTHEELEPGDFVTKSVVLAADPGPVHAVLDSSQVRPGGQISLQGVGCPPSETVTVETDDPEVPGRTTTADTYGIFWWSASSNPAASSGDVVTVTVTCGDPSAPGSQWTGAVTYLGEVAQPPVARDDTATTPQGTPVTVDVLANDEGPNLRLFHVNPPTHGTAELHTDGRSVTYTPDPEFVGIEIVEYSIENDDGVSGGNLEITVTAAESDESGGAEGDAGADGAASGTERGDDSGGDADAGGATGHHAGGDAGADGDDSSVGGVGTDTGSALPDTGTVLSPIGWLAAVVLLVAGATILTTRRRLVRPSR